MKKVELPIDAFKDQILECINNNPVSIIVAETGAGKSTRVPQFLLESSDYQIVVTQPRRVAAKAVAKRVAEEMQCRFGGLVGFRTAVDRNDSEETRCLFATDGLQLVRELTSAQKSMGQGVCLIIDEVHEWNLNIETLVAWAKRHILSGADIKVILMSATLDSQRLSEFFDNAPVIEVPGRCFPVEGSPTHPGGIIQKNANEMLAEIKRLVAEGANSLVFLPGKGEIKQLEDALKKVNLSAVVLPLHGDVESKEQDLVFESFSLPKVVLATNIAQTSLTIPDIDAVVDSGLERRIVLINNVETLLLGNISQTDVRQRAGRAGRTKEGQYVLCNDNDYCNFESFPTPEIQRSLLDQMVLRLAAAGFDALDLPFFHQPSKQTLVEAKELLYAIEALDKDGKITKIGKQINRFPIGVMSARMILEAIERRCLESIITITAILGTRYGTLRRRKRDNDPEDYKSWEKLIDNNKKYKSDLLLELDLFNIARGIKSKELAANGLDLRSFGSAIEIREQIKNALHNLGYVNHSNKEVFEEEILKCIASGMLVHLYRSYGGGEYVNGETRMLARESIIQKLYHYPDWIVGEPMNINIINRRGRQQTIALVKTATIVNPLWFVELAPHLIEKKLENLRFDSETMSMIEDSVVIFNGTEISREKKVADYKPEILDKFVYSLVNSYFSSDCSWKKIKNANEIELNKYKELRVRSGGNLQKLDSSFLIGHYKQVLEKALVGQEIKNLTIPVAEVILGGFESLYLPLNSYLSGEEEAQVLLQNPDLFEIAGQTLPITYGESYGECYAKITVKEDFVQEFDSEKITLPSGRELIISCDNYVGTISEVRIKLHERMIANFKSTTSELIGIPKEEPFMTHSWGWEITDLGRVLRSGLEEIQIEVVKNLNSYNNAELIETVKIKAEELKNNFRTEYEKAKALIASVEEKFNNILAEIEIEFIQEEVLNIRNQFAEVKSFLKKGDFIKVNNFYLEAEEMIAKLKSLSVERQRERELLIKKNNLPDYLLSAFGGDLSRALQFVDNVEQLPTEKLDDHIIGVCGRSRVKTHLEEFGGENFFLGADPNDVKYYVYNYHFGVIEKYEEDATDDDEPVSNNSIFAEAFRRAGLIK